MHEIFIDLNDSSDTSKICDELFVREKDYLDPSKISKMQVSYSALCLFIDPSLLCERGLTNVYR